jgi:hypothetical protein
MRVCPAQSLRFCGRQFSLAELEKLRHWLAEGQCHRSELARRVCAEFGWINGAGQPKLMSSRVALLRMERAGLVRLPPPQTRNGNRRRSNREPTTALALPWASGPRPLNPLTGLRLERVETPAEAALYRQMMDRYHYLGHTPLAGAQMRYVIRCQTTVLGGMGFGASAWSVAVRDRFIGWPPQQRQKQLHLIVNHSRFLLLPGAGSPNLASCVLAQVSRQLPGQWQKRYGYRPVLLESFVEKDRFAGTCYKAANWQCLGLTKGRGKLEKTGQPTLPVKWVFVYPLCTDFIARLNG